MKLSLPTIPALSKHDIKPFSKIETFLLGFAGCYFFQKLPPEAQLNHETYAFFVKKNERMISKKAIYDIGTEIRLKKSDSHKHIKDWEIENVKT